MELQEKIIEQLASGVLFTSLYEQNLELGDDELVMAAAIYQDTANFQYASGRLRGDVEFILANTDRGQSEEHLLRYANPSVLHDERILFGLSVEELTHLYPVFGEELRSKTEVAQIALVGADYKRNLRFIPKKLWNDEAFALRAVLAQGSLLIEEPQLSSKYWRVPEFWWAAIRTDGLVLKHAFHEYRADYEFVMAAVKQNGKALKYAALPLRDDEAIVKLAIKSEPMAWRYASERVQNILAIHS